MFSLLFVWGGCDAVAGALCGGATPHVAAESQLPADASPRGAAGEAATLTANAIAAIAAITIAAAAGRGDAGARIATAPTLQRMACD